MLTKTKPKENPIKDDWKSMGRLPEWNSIAHCCGILSLSPWTYRTVSNTNNKYNLNWSQIFHPNQVQSYLEFAIPPKKNTARLAVVILNEKENNSIGEIFLKFGFEPVPSISNIRNPNTDNLLYTYIYNLAPKYK